MTSDNPLVFKTNRVAFLVDGFNVYWSIAQALREGIISKGKWLNYAELFRNLIRDQPEFNSTCVLTKVIYFSAYAGFMNSRSPGTVDRHRLFIKALKNTGVEVVLGQYKSKDLKCKASCKETYISHEEKETDVNIALGLIELMFTDACDTVVIVSGDSDLCPAIKMSKKHFPDKVVAVCFPYAKKNKEVSLVADFCFKLKAQTYQKYQFPDSINTAEGTTITKPINW